jgi:hypothetical protein
MRVENDLVEFVTVDDSEYEEIIEEYEEEIFVPKEFLEPPMTDTIDTAPAQGKPRCITHIFYNLYIYMWCIYVAGILLYPHAYIYLPMSPASAGFSSALL